MARPKGSPNVKTAHIARKALKEGITPIEVMLKAMRHEVDQQLARPVAERDWEKAANFAKDAAPYCHPRLSAVAHTGADDGPIEFKDVPAVEVARRYAFLLTAAEKEQAEQAQLTEH